MDEAQKCSKCGYTVPPSSRFRVCPNCLLELAGRGSDLFGAGRAEEFEDYELIEPPIGSGSMAEVYKARQVSLNRLVAVKKLHASDADDPVLATRLRVEAEATAKLNHPNIVVLYAVGEHAGQPFISMQLVEGSGMNRLIGAGGFHYEPTCPIVREKRKGLQVASGRVMSKIAWAVDHAHKHGILHRDLKPANVVIDQRGEPHLTDFGLAKILGRDALSGTAPGTLQGTPAYMSPEQAQGKPASTASDIYSLGATLYSMLTGQPPFKADTVPEILHKLINEDPKHPALLNDSVDADLATVCMKCLEKDPQARYSSAQALAEELERWLRCEPIEARPVRVIERVWRWVRREPELAGLLAGLFMLMGAIAILSFTLYKRERAHLERLNIDNNQLLGQLHKRVKDEWYQAERMRPRRGVFFAATDLALLLNEKFITEGNEVVVGVAAPGQHADPINQMQKHLPFLKTLQNSEGEFVFGFYLYKSEGGAIEGLTEDQHDRLDLVRLTSTAFVLLSQQTSISLDPLVQESPDIRAVIFTREDSGITNLQQLKGGTLILGNRDSSIGHYFPKAALAAEGLRSGDLRLIEDVSSTRVVSAVNRSPRFLPEDLKDVSRFIERLTSNSNQVSAYIRERLDEATVQELENCVNGRKASPLMVRYLTTNLNALVKGPSIWEPSRFAGVVLRPETQKLCDAHPTGVQLSRLNRLLLEDAYPQEIELYAPFDAGVAEKEEVQGWIESGERLRIIKEFDCPDFVWVATAKMNGKTKLLVKQRLLEPKLGGARAFTPVDTAELMKLDERIQEARTFDQVDSSEPSP